MADAKEDALRMLAERKVTFDSLSEKGSAHAVSERLRAWIKDTAEKLREHIVEDEVQRFIPDYKISRFWGVPPNSNEEFELYLYIRNLVNEKLNILQETVSNHPNQILNALKKPSTPSAGPYFAMMHPTIIAHAKRRFDYREYADAVEAAVKEVNVRVKDYVKNKTQKELDGTPLMTFAFSPSDPVITLAEITNQSGKSEQNGYMRIFEGLILGIRNPKAHSNLSITSERCVHLLMLASLLMFKLDEAQVP